MSTENWSAALRRNPVTSTTLAERRAKRYTLAAMLCMMLLEMAAAFTLGRYGFPWEHLVCR